MQFAQNVEFYRN